MPILKKQLASLVRDVTALFARAALKSVERQGWIHKTTRKEPYSLSFYVRMFPAKFKS